MICRLILILLGLAAAAIIILCGCTVSRVEVDARTWQIGVGHSYQRSTDVAASDDDTADVQAEGQLSLPRPILGVEPQNGGWRWWDGRGMVKRAGWEPTRAEAVAMQEGE